jgi:GMP synthase (glutamine-hydrolysing)
LQPAHNRSPINRLRYLLLQIRNENDPMRRQEIHCFARALRCETSRIDVFDLLSGVPPRDQLDRADVVLLGGSGHYSVATEGDWLQRALESMRQLYELSKPTFASCWGFQAMSRALGGTVIHDAGTAEVGTHQVRLTESGRDDPVFGRLGDVFEAQMGHEDRVVTLPPSATLLASSARVENQAFRLDGRPIYCTQFHAELNRNDLLERVNAYPEYVRHVSGMSIEQFGEACRDTPESESLLPRFVEHVFG